MGQSAGWFAVALMVAATVVHGHGKEHHGKPAEPPQVLAPGYSPLTFDAPAPGSYSLARLGPAGDGEVLDADGKPGTLAALQDGRVTVLSFIYTSCDDVNGCPLSTAVKVKLARAISRTPALAGRVRLLTLSFDPAVDTPERLAGYRDALALGKDADAWRFVTTASERELLPILDAYGQQVQRMRGEDGKPNGVYSHILRVVLIDGSRVVRNIYSVAFLHADVLLNDIRTLLMEEDGVLATAGAEVASVQGAGDVREGYERADFVTTSRSLAARDGDAIDLLARARAARAGLPAVPGIESIDSRQVALGRKLFFDRRLSHNATFSCAMCHVPEQGFASNELAMAVGIEGRTVRRNAPTLYNVAYQRRLFHDARENTLAQQAWSPLLAANEMGNPSIGHVVNRLRALPDYRGLFEAAFDGVPAGMQTIGDALAAYQATLVSADSAFDRWRYGGESEALEASARRGFELFTGKAGCSACHQVGERDALFADHAVHNTGIGYRRSMGDGDGPVRVQLAPGVFVDVDRDAYAAAAEEPPSDLGRYEVTLDPADRWKFRTPTLRNIALTAPYMHDGSIGTLAEVVDFYARGGVVNEGLSPLMRPLDLDASERADLVRFMEALTGSDVDTLVGDAFAAPIGDEGITRAAD